MRFTINGRKFYIEYLRNEIVEISIQDGNIIPTKHGKYILYTIENGEYKKLVASLTYEILYRVAFKVATHKSIDISAIPEFMENAA